MTNTLRNLSLFEADRLTLDGAIDLSLASLRKNVLDSH